MRKIIQGFIFSGLLALSFWAGFQIARDRGMPFLMIRQFPWSIGIYGGESPFQLKPIQGVKNPVLTAADVTDTKALFVADPFMIQRENEWIMFFEILNQATNQGDIGIARSPNGLQWKYEKIVLDEPFHLSYPYVFEWEGNYYLIPESAESNSVRLYKAKSFPDRWVLEKKIIEGVDYEDPSIIYHEGFWFLFVSPQYDHDTLHLYYAKELAGPWLEHPKSPIVKNNGHHARPGGRVIFYQGKPFRFAQDDIPVYGNQVHAFEILKMTPASYEEKAYAGNPVLKRGEGGWNVTRMHHMDPHQIREGEWISTVDGYGTYTEFSLKN